MIKSLCIASCLFLCLFASSQDQKIVYSSTGFGTAFYQGERLLKPKDLVSLTDGHPEANLLMDKAKTNSDMANVFGFIGGALIGWPVGTALGGGDPNWTLAAIGAGAVLISIPLARGYKKNAIKGAELYNESVSSSAFNRGVDFQLTAGQSGIGLSMTF